jgi:hypothetical protein
MAPACRRYRALLIYSILALVALTNSGCLVAILGTAAAGGAVGYAYYHGNVSRDFLAPLGPTVAATDRAVRDLGLPVMDGKMDGTTATIESQTPEGDRVAIYMEPVPGATYPATRVHVRVGWFGDHELTGQLHRRIATHLQQQAPADPGSPSIIDQPPPPQGVTPASHTQEPPLATDRSNQFIPPNPNLPRRSDAGFTPAGTHQHDLNLSSTPK